MKESYLEILLTLSVAIERGSLSKDEAARVIQCRFYERTHTQVLHDLDTVHSKASRLIEGLAKNIEVQS